MKQQIKHRHTDAVIFEAEAATLSEVVILAVSRGADLGGANLDGADLRGADLGGANLGSANLRGADLGGANLGSADLSSANLSSANLGGANLSSANLGSANLRGADLSGANLGGAYLSGVTVAWQSHDLIAHLLFAKAGDDISKRSLAGLILISQDWCWKQFIKMDHPQRKWAIGVLKALKPDGMPDQLKAIIEKAA